MPVVSNTLPFLNLAIIDHLFLLPQQFGQIHIPPAVLSELKINDNLRRSGALQTAIKDGWLIPQTLKDSALVSLLRQDLHQGESEAIALAVELAADTILLDKKEVRRAARALELGVTGILGVLLRGRFEGSIPSLKAVIDRLQQEANFWVAPALRA
ncbi:DUF3368 domain-containing protein [Nodosilinea sp. FACHB-13]|uniref:DUF3368 domain-containing protein n=1 Tax=Cyanophyceae TaxID=3028117 RepID=UPI00168942B5|nr:DUF3368 domain-containing protein [Nodosilinea sp. FACHB-13]MBD2108700.1 DUF3368 domain-containing protein [Nodosilinea sp. FACHB-13]